MEIVTAASLCGCWNVHCWTGEDTGLNTWNRESAGVMLSHLQQSNFGDVSLRNLCELEKRHARRKAMKKIKRAYAAQQRWPGMAAREPYQFAFSSSRYSYRYSRIGVKHVRSRHVLYGFTEWTGDYVCRSLGNS